MTTFVAINPGTGDVANSQLAQATENMEAFLADMNLDGATFERLEKRDYDNGRFAFRVCYGASSVEVQMPGIPLERVRYMGYEGQNIWRYPRLYVEGSSWVWSYAYDIARTDLIADEMSEGTDDNEQ
jgi:hypothetical protein